MQTDIAKYVYGNYEVLVFLIKQPSETFIAQVVITDDLGTSSLFQVPKEYATKDESVKASKLYSQEIIQKHKTSRELFKELLQAQINQRPEISGIQIGGWGKTKNDFIEDKISLDIYKVNDDKRVRCIIKLPRSHLLNLNEATENEKQNLIEDSIKQVNEADWEILQLFI